MRYQKQRKVARQHKSRKEALPNDPFDIDTVAIQAISPGIALFLFPFMVAEWIMGKFYKLLRID